MVNKNATTMIDARRNVGYMFLATASPAIAAQMKAGIKTTPILRSSMQSNISGMRIRSRQNLRDAASASVRISTRGHGTHAPKKAMSLNG